MGDWVIFKGLRVKRSDVGKVLRHLDRLRQETGRIRVRLVPLKMEGKISSDLELKNPYQELIDTFEQLIATNEKEMEDLRKALRAAMESHSGNDHREQRAHDHGSEKTLEEEGRWSRQWTGS